MRVFSRIYTAFDLLTTSANLEVSTVRQRRLPWILRNLVPPHTTDMPALTALPPFPDNVPSHPLLVIDYELLQIRDDHEIAKLWKAATELGFW